MFGAEGALQLRPGKSLYSRACALLRKYLFRGLLPCRLSAMFSPAPHHITPRSLTANHRPRFPPTSGGGAARRGAARPQRGRHTAVPGAAPARPGPAAVRAPRSRSRSLREGGLAAVGVAKGTGICLDRRQRLPMGSGKGRTRAALAQWQARFYLIRLPEGYKSCCVRASPSLTQYGRRH